MRQRGRDWAHANERSNQHTPTQQTGPRVNTFHSHLIAMIDNLSNRHGESFHIVKTLVFFFVKTWRRIV